MIAQKNRTKETKIAQDSLKFVANLGGFYLAVEVHKIHILELAVTATYRMESNNNKIRLQLK